MPEQKRNEYVSRARTVEEAVSEALLYLGARRNEVEITVLDEGKSGLLGLIGRKPAVVRVRRRPRRREAQPIGGRGDRRGERRDGRRAAANGEGTEGRPAGDERRQASRRDDQAEGEAPRSRRRRPRRRRRPEGEVADATDRREDGSPSTRPAGEVPQEDRAVPAAAGDGEPGRGSRRRRRRPRHRRHPKGEAAGQETRAAESSEQGGVVPGEGTVEETPTSERRAETVSSAETATPPNGPAAEVETWTAAQLVAPRPTVPVSEAAELQRGLAEELMRRCGFISRTTVHEGEYNQVRIVTDGDSASVLIGHHGVTIYALEHLVDRLSARILGEHVPVNVDVNNYRRRREGRLVEQAQRAVSRVRATGEEVHLPPQNARDRRVVHLEVARHEGVATYTVGEGEERHVVVTFPDRVPPDYQPPAAAQASPAPGASSAAGDAGDPEQ